MKALKYSRQLRFRNANTRISDLEQGMIRLILDADCNAALQCEFKGIRKQIENDLLPHVPVEVDRAGAALAVHRKVQPSSFHCRTERAREISRQSSEVRWFERSL